MDTWRDGQKASVVKKTIDDNFIILDNQLSNAILALSTAKRQMLNSRYLRVGLIVFDTTLQRWLQYNGTEWIDYDFPNKGYVKTIEVSDWGSSKTITIPFSQHCTPNPIVSLLMYSNSLYEEVLGGVSVDEGYNVVLSTDLSFKGKVVIK